MKARDGYDELKTYFFLQFFFCQKQKKMYFRRRRVLNPYSYAGGGGGGGAGQILHGLPEDEIRKLHEIQAGEKDGQVYVFPFDITPISDATRQKMRKYIQQQLIQGSKVPHRNPAQIAQSDAEGHEHPDAKIHWWLHLNLQSNKDFIVRKKVLAALWKYAPMFYPNLSGFRVMNQLVEKAVDSIETGEHPIDTLYLLSSQVPGAIEQITLTTSDMQMITQRVKAGITDAETIRREIFPRQAQAVAALRARTTRWKIVELGVLRNPAGQTKTIGDLVDITKLLPNDECPICIDSLSEFPENIEMVPNCGHLFHKTCIDKWRRSGGHTCPKCRGSIVGDIALGGPAFIARPPASRLSGDNVAKYKRRGARDAPRVPVPPMPVVQVPLSQQIPGQSITELPIPRSTSKSGLYFVFDFDHTLTYRHSGGNVIADVDYMGQDYEELSFLLRLLRCFGDVFILSRSPKRALVNNLQSNHQLLPDILDASRVFGSSGPQETSMSGKMWTEKKVAVLEKMYRAYQPSSKQDIIFFDDEIDNINKAAEAGFTAYHTDPKKTSARGPTFPQVTMQNIRHLLHHLGERYGVETAMAQVRP